MLPNKPDAQNGAKPGSIFNPGPGPRKVWKLDQGALDALLSLLGPDPHQAAGAYEDLRQRLIRLFQMHQMSDPDLSADVCLDRLAKRVHEGVLVEKPLFYALGIARMRLREERALLRRESQMIEDFDRHSLSAHTLSQHEHLERLRAQEAEQALEICLAKIPPEQRRQVLLYYSAVAREGIDLRQQLAAENGISLNALRNRMLRLRRSLEECLKQQIRHTARQRNQDQYGRQRDV